jgi:hypothetical protein
MALNVLTDSRGITSSKGDFSKFIRDASSLIEDAISEIQRVGIKVNSR